MLLFGFLLSFAFGAMRINQLPYLSLAAKFDCIVGPVYSLVTLKALLCYRESIFNELQKLMSLLNLMVGSIASLPLSPQLFCSCLVFWIGYFLPVFFPIIIIA